MYNLSDGNGLSLMHNWRFDGQDYPQAPLSEFVGPETFAARGAAPARRPQHPLFFLQTEPALDSAPAVQSSAELTGSQGRPLVRKSSLPFMAKVSGSPVDSFPSTRLGEEQMGAQAPAFVRFSREKDVRRDFPAHPVETFQD